MSQTNFVLMIMYDIPLDNANAQKAYRKLNRYLQAQGFYLLQASIYLKPLSEKHKAQMYIAAIKKLAQKGSHIRALLITHTAFLAMETIIGADTWGEQLIKHPNSILTW